MTTVQNLSVSALQLDILWENTSQNLQTIKEKVKEAKGELVVLAEMCLTGFSMAPQKIAIELNSPIIEELRTLAIESSKALIFSAAVLDEGNYYNRLYFITPQGEISTYNKRHLFAFAGEDKSYTAGSERLIIEYKGFKICPLVCYDLRFGVYSRNVDNEYDLLIYIASWPESRAYPWSTLLRARAIENICYTVGVNRVGSDPKNVYSGDSVILDYCGMPLVEAAKHQVAEINYELSLDKLRTFREEFAAYRDADKFTLHL